MPLARVIAVTVLTPIRVKLRVEIRAPEEAGRYEVRYHLASSYRVIGSADLEVTSAEATVSAPASVQAGGSVEVTWSGPDNQRDFVSIDPPGCVTSRVRTLRLHP